MEPIQQQEARLPQEIWQIKTMVSELSVTL